MELYRDGFADLSDAELARLHAEPAVAAHLSAADFRPHELFLFDDYEWSGFYVPGQFTLMLTQGFFTFVGTRDMETLAGRKPSANVWRHEGTGEIIKVRAVLHHADKRVYLHSFLIGAQGGDITDHVNRLALDNRSEENLWNTTSSANNSNRIQVRRAPGCVGLKVGVEKRAGGMYGGVVKYKGINYRSEETWADQNKAHDWYFTKHAELHKTVETKRPAFNLPVFPPRKDGKPTIIPGVTPAVTSDICATF
ncbi:MAG: hypothetical protein KGI70_01720 [Patescibacteria group bacterium]|nr:hypothetical protein [Patescibacteria group bacterium]